MTKLTLHANVKKIPDAFNQQDNLALASVNKADYKYLFNLFYKYKEDILC